MRNLVNKVKNSFWNLLNPQPPGPDEDEYGDEHYEDDQSVYGYRGSRDDSRYRGEREEGGRSYQRSHDENSDYYDDASSAQPRWGEKRPSSNARQAQNNKVLEMHGKAGLPRAEVVVRRPTNVEDSCKICNLLCEERICIVDLTGMERSMAQRIADFLGGACYAINGSIHRVSKDIFIIVPDGVRITAELAEEIEKDGYSFASKTRR